VKGNITACILLLEVLNWPMFGVFLRGRGEFVIRELLDVLEKDEGIQEMNEFFLLPLTMENE